LGLAEPSGASCVQEGVGELYIDALGRSGLTFGWGIPHPDAGGVRPGAPATLAYDFPRFVSGPQEGKHYLSGVSLDFFMRYTGAGPASVSHCPRQGPISGGRM
jgi:hypothetical protein